MSELNGSDGWVRRFHPAPRAAARLICFPHAGGASTYFFPVSRTLSPGIEVLAIQYPGRQDRRTEPLIDDLHVLADVLAPVVKPWCDGPPVYLYGHSMGATLAFEVGVRLTQEGAAPRALVVSGRRAPSTFRDERVHLLSDDDFIRDLDRLSGTDPRLFEDPQVVEMILPALRNDYRAAETYRYRPGPRLDCPVVALIGDEDAQVTVEEARVWSEHTTGRFDLGVYRGGHFFINDHAADVMRVIREVAAGRTPALPGQAIALRG
ncbi:MULTISPECIES: thioesterase II family protein [Microbispora]|uniref:Thioesterase n=1 Tax=Microbispora triticiradicis TaxID=2200763 RepID=A0ABX9LAV8_9ACTN|nr:MULTISPECIES: alpha/beta fold hydrolase [Microbispora]RGA00940.1 thioesterase [Microbispora triticiradicis]